MRISEIKKLVNEENKNQKIIEQSFYEEVENNLIQLIKEELYDMSTNEAINTLISEINYKEKKNNYVNPLIREEIFDVNIGDICLVDFGKQYQCECSYVHPALIISQSKMKLCVIPITSNTNSFQKACFWQYENLIPLIYNENNTSNIEKNSTLILNDMSWINSSRIISKIGNIDVTSKEFDEILSRIISLTTRGKKRYEKNLSWLQSNAS